MTVRLFQHNSIGVDVFDSCNRFMFAKLSSLHSSIRLNFKLIDFFKPVKLSNVFGSTTRFESDFTLLIATYKIPAVSLSCRYQSMLFRVLTLALVYSPRKFRRLLLLLMHAI